MHAGNEIALFTLPYRNHVCLAHSQIHIALQGASNCKNRPLRRYPPRHLSMTVESGTTGALHGIAAPYPFFSLYYSNVFVLCQYLPDRYLCIGHDQPSRRVDRVGGAFLTLS
jgi:hypothetical protein